MNKLKVKNGISLIVLVITIIVMIILAGAVIISLSNSNVVSKAKEARDMQDFNQIRESIEMEQANAIFPGATFNTANVTIPSKYASNISITAEGTPIIIAPFSDPLVTARAAEALGAVYIPTGFVASKATGEMSKENGLVIYEGTAEVNDSNVATAKTTRNQYVWIPVVGNLARVDFLNDPTGFGFYSEESGAAYDAMKVSVEKYNGFYVGRYEAGTDVVFSDIAIQDGSQKPLSKQDVYVFNYVQYDETGTYPGTPANNGAARVAKYAYMTGETENAYIRSGLLYGSQYDAMLNFVSGSSTNLINSTNWGNHSNSTFSLRSSSKYSDVFGYTYISGNGVTKLTNSDAILTTTGASEQNKAKNIYDIAGNVWELTYELCPTEEARTLRGGYSVYSGLTVPAASRSPWLVSYCDGYVGFRVALYIK